MQLRVNMLGDYIVSLDGNPLGTLGNSGNRSIQLMQYLLYNYGRSVTRDALCYAIYGDDIEADDPTGAFRVALHRLRKMLDDAGLPPYTYVVISKGMYSWNNQLPDMTVTTDVGRFEELCKAASEMERSEGGKTAAENQELLDMRMEAVSLYKGDLLPANSSADWVIVETARLGKQYRRTVEMLSKQLHETGQYEMLYDVMLSATQIYPYEEIYHCALIRSLLALGKPREALKQYESAAKMYYAELGVLPGAEMQALHNEISKKLPESSESMVSIKHSIEHAHSKQGAFYCNYAFFMESYHLVVRLLERSGQTAFMMLCKLTDTHGNVIMDEEKSAAASSVLNEIINSSLRKGDIYTSLAVGKFLLLLTGINQENCAIVTERIDKRFHKAYAGRGCRLSFKILPVDLYDESYGR